MFEDDQRPDRTKVVCVLRAAPDGSPTVHFHARYPKALETAQARRMRNVALSFGLSVVFVAHPKSLRTCFVPDRKTWKISRYLQDETSARAYFYDRDLEDGE